MATNLISTKTEGRELIECTHKHRKSPAWHGMAAATVLTIYCILPVSSLVSCLFQLREGRMSDSENSGNCFVCLCVHSKLPLPNCCASNDHIIANSCVDCFHLSPAYCIIA